MRILQSVAQMKLRHLAPWQTGNWGKFLERKKNPKDKKCDSIRLSGWCVLALSFLAIDVSPQRSRRLTLVYSLKDGGRGYTQSWTRAHAFSYLTLILKIYDTGDETCGTFIIHDEDHTIGNSLRYALMKKFIFDSMFFLLMSSPKVDFAGYSIPHPLDKALNVRIQTLPPEEGDPVPASSVFHEALNDLEFISNHVLSTFQNAVADYKALKNMWEIFVLHGSDWLILWI